MVLPCVRCVISHGSASGCLAWTSLRSLALLLPLPQWQLGRWLQIRCLSSLLLRPVSVLITSVRDLGLGSVQRGEWPMPLLTIPPRLANGLCPTQSPLTICLSRRWDVTLAGGVPGCTCVSGRCGVSAHTTCHVPPPYLHQDRGGGLDAAFLADNKTPHRERPNHRPNIYKGILGLAFIAHFV